MSRLVEPTTKTFNLAGAKKTDAKSAGMKEYGERVAKYVPAEVLACYTAAVSLIGALPKDDSKRLWLFGLVLVFFWAATPIWLGSFTNNKSIKITNQVVGAFAFVVWAYAFPAGLFCEYKPFNEGKGSLYDSVTAGVILILFSFASGFKAPKAEES